MMMKLELKRAECVADIADLEKELERAKGRLEFIDELFAELVDEEDETAEETEEDGATEEYAETL